MEPGQDEPRNTIYRKVSRGKRRLTRGRLLLYRVAVAIGYRIGRFWWWSTRMQPALGVEAARAAVRQHGAVIPAFWHQHLFYGARALVDLEPDGLKPGFLISPSVDGTAPALLVERIGGHVIRGSSTHTGARALKDFYDLVVKQKVSPAITPDGPLGPLHEFKPGAVLLSQLTGRPIIPISVVAAQTFRFRTWDRFELPLPFTRVQIAYGDPVQVPRVVNAEGLAGLQREMAERLEALRARAREALERRGH
ncbi:MAG: DUF374 domain-containing protein [Steroidobacteraceae bacterium]